jgi:cell division transport system permease protein
MILDFLRANPFERRLLPEGRSAGPIPWMIAILMFLTVLATAAGLAVGQATAALDRDIAGKLTVQLAEPNVTLRNGQITALQSELQKLTAVKLVHRLDDTELAELLHPWLGDDALAADLPIPALIDVTLAKNGAADVAEVRSTVKAVAPAARVDAHADWLAPLSGLLGALGWLATGLVVLMAGATAAAVVMAARSAINTHHETIAIMHFLGATDIQVARLFQRRIALDALFGGIVGLSMGVAVLVILGGRIGAIGSDLLGSATISWWGWLLIFLLPVAGAALATVVARLTVTTTLSKIL